MVKNNLIKQTSKIVVVDGLAKAEHFFLVFSIVRKIHLVIEVFVMSLWLVILESGKDYALFPKIDKNVEIPIIQSRVDFDFFLIKK